MPDFLGLMKQAAQLQAKVKAMQDELELIEVEGVAGGGLVSVRLSGKGEMKGVQIEVEGTAGGGMLTVTMTAKGEHKGVKIDDSLLKPSEKEILEDLLVAAHADARRKAEAVLQEKMKSLTGGLPLPPGLGLG